MRTIQEIPANSVKSIQAAMALNEKRIKNNQRASRLIIIVGACVLMAVGVLQACHCI